MQIERDEVASDDTAPNRTRFITWEPNNAQHSDSKPTNITFTALWLQWKKVLHRFCVWKDATTSFTKLAH